MNRGFRKAFLNLFRCFKKFHGPRRMSIGGGVRGLDGAVGGNGHGTTVNGITQVSENDMSRMHTQRLYRTPFIY